MASQEKTPQQKRGILRTVLLLVGLMTLFVGGFFNKMLQPRIMSEIELRTNGAIVFDNPRIINDFNLTTHTGNDYTLDDLKGKWTIMFFGFTQCPDICPVTLAKLSQMFPKLDDSIAENTRVVLVSVDPARDTPEKLAPYITHFNEEFTGVTGEFLDTMKLTQNLNVAFRKVMQGNDYTVDHTGNIVIINPNGHYHAFIKPPFELARLITVYQSIYLGF
ncbi:SCO family protein [Teredinibacter purpureus]|uniref:SCO family protein n=1 Tax=Teredinibacter purpureus TaxID=2731756 RepID=UPI0005F8975E|nr:SCO family protein [Teredinibacter purpureus]